MREWQKIISSVIIGIAIVVGALILADAIRYLGNSIRSGLIYLR